MIFISHKHDPDHEYALKIANILKKNGINYWIAPESIESGNDFATDVPRAINACELFLLVLTENTHLSAHVRKEVNLAISHKKRIIPIKIGDFDLDDSFEYLLADVQIVPFSFSEGDIKSLVEVCATGERVVEMEVGKNPTQKLTLIKGGFQENMDYLIENDPEEFEKTVFAMGIDCTSRLDLSSNKGIVKWVCKYLLEKYNIGIDYLQKLLNEAKINQLGHKTTDEPMRFKDIVLIRVPLHVDNSKTLTLKLLMVGNSIKNSAYEKSLDVDEVEGIDSREIIISVFNKCAELSDDICNLFIGAMGTNGLGFPYEVAVSETLNCFVYAYRTKGKPQNLYFSMRKEDMDREGLHVEDILSYTKSVINFIK